MLHKYVVARVQYSSLVNAFETGNNPNTSQYNTIVKLIWPVFHQLAEMTHV